MILEEKDVLELLRCPQSGATLVAAGNMFLSSSAGDGPQYPIIDGYPVLVDFENSVLSYSDVRSLSSVIDRRSYKGLFGFTKRLVSPEYSVTARNVEHLLSLLRESSDRPRVLVVGGGSMGQGMAPLYEDPDIQLVAFDIYASPLVQFVADAHSIPLPDESFDGVVVQAVLEHVLEPETVVSEIHRVLNADGIVYAETPFLQHVHEGAYDFTRFTESGHRYLFRHFELIDSGAVSGAGTQLLWSIDNFVRGLFRSRRVGKVAKLLFFWLQYCDRLIPDAYNIDAASGVFFLGRKQTSLVRAKQMIAHYKGAQ